MKNLYNNKFLIIFLIAVIILFLAFSFFFGPKIFSETYEIGSNLVADVAIQKIEEKSSPLRIKTPKPLRAIYMTACVAGTKNFRDELVKLIDETEINSIVIDVKDFSGTISFPTENPKLIGVKGTGCKANDMKDFVKELHEKGIYTIARLTVFQDPFYVKTHPELAVLKKSDNSPWKDFKGISFIEVGAKDYWEYVLELAKESYDLGFDEVNFDYIRFPSDGNMKDIYFPFSDKIISENPENGKAIALENFFKHLDSEIKKFNKNKKDPLITSADLFGMVTTNTDDLNIGQVLERALPYFDYVAPMVYPSHYPNGFNNWTDPNKYPYELIHFVMGSAVERVEALKNATDTPEWVKERVKIEQLRPWLQDFDYDGDYGPAEVSAQIKAVYDAGLDSWMLWAPSNRYTRASLENAE